jgi:hypothetical protein
VKTKMDGNIKFEYRGPTQNQNYSDYTICSLGYLDKEERIGKVIDWTQKKSSNIDEENEYNKIFTKKIQNKIRTHKQKRINPQQTIQQTQKISLAIKKTVQFQKKLAKKKGKFNQNTTEKTRKNQNLKSTLQENFETLQFYNFSDLIKLRMDTIPKSELLKEVGYTKVFNEDFNHIDMKNAIQLKNSSKQTNRCKKIILILGTSSEDPILKEYAEKKEGNVFATDQILSFILASPKSVYPW